MIQRVDEAIVLRTWPFQEADLLVSLFTREQGRVKGVARHALRSRRRFGGALEPMTHVRASYAEKPSQELVRLDGFEIVSSPMSRPVDYARLAALEMVAEVLEEALPEGAPEDAVFRLALAVLDELQVGRVWMPITYFALWMNRAGAGGRGGVVLGRERRGDVRGRPQGRERGAGGGIGGAGRTDVSRNGEGAGGGGLAASAGGGPAAICD